MRRQRGLVALAGVTVALLLAPRAGNIHVAADVPTYTIEDLGATSDGAVPAVTAVNNDGVVSGTASQQAVRHANGGSFDYLPGFAAMSTGMAVNVHGDVAGYASTDAGMRAYRHSGGAPQFIDPVPEGSFTVGLGISGGGAVVGYTNTADGFRAFRAMPAMPIEILPTLDNGFTLATAVNDNGDVAGSSSLQIGVQHAFRLDANGMHDLGSLAADGSTMSSATAIDASGDVVGRSTNLDGYVQAFRHSAGQMQDIDSLNTGFSNAVAVSGKWTVGYFQLEDGSQRAFVHSHADGMVDLNSRIDANSGWVLMTATGVNASGQIVGMGWFNDGPHAYRLTRQDTTPPAINSVTATPSSLVPPNNAMVVVAVNVDATDDSGEAPTCSLTSVAASTGNANDYTVTGALSASLRAVANSTYTLIVQCADAAGNKSVAATAVVVPPDTTPPAFTSLTATPSVIVPPNGARVNVTTSATATDDSGQTPVCKLANVSGPGRAGVDFDVTGANTGWVLAVGGRTYAFRELCVDLSNNVAYASVNVVVPPDTTAPLIGSVSATPSTIATPNNQMVPVAIAVSATDDSGAAPVCSVKGIASTGGSANDYAVTGPLAVSVRAAGGRTYTVQVSCADQAGNTSSAAVAVVVLPDTTPPVISNVSVTPSTIWPPNGQFWGVGVSASATDNSGAAPECSVTSVTANDGSTNDAVITGPWSVSVKSLKDRVYSIYVTCGDDAGNTSESFANVFVAKDHGNGGLIKTAKLLAERKFVHGHKK